MAVDFTREIASKFLDYGGAVYNVRAYGVTGDGSTDDTSALAALQALVAAESRPARIVFPAGTYLYSESPNWAIQDCEIVAQGHVRLRYTGTGNAVILDGGASGGVRNCVFGGDGRFIIEAPSTAQNAIYVRAFHAGRVRAKVLGAGTTYSGMRVEFAVCTEFDVVVSVNHEGWFSSAKPENGYYLTIRDAGETVSYCSFVNPIVEGTNIGIYLNGTLGNVFLGGTSEGCTQYGVFASTAAILDRFYGTDFEVNTSADVFCQGQGLTFDHCDSEDLIYFGSSALKCNVVGGRHKSITMDAGSSACTVRDVQYNRANDGGAITNSGHNNRVRNVQDAGNNYPMSDGERYITLEDDFLGDTLAVQWNGTVGGNANIVAPVAGGAQAGGYVGMTAGDGAGADMATNGVQLTQGTQQWRASTGDLEMEFRIQMDAITNVAWFVGLTDQSATLEMPFTLGAGDALTSNASNAVGVLFDTAADTDEWALVGVASDVDATVQFSGAAPVANTWERWRIHVTSNGVARFFRNSALVGTSMAGAITPATLLTPYVGGFSRGTATRTIRCDRIKLRVERE